MAAAACGFNGGNVSAWRRINRGSGSVSGGQPAQSLEESVAASKLLLANESRKLAAKAPTIKCTAGCQQLFNERRRRNSGLLSLQLSWRQLFARSC